MRCNLCAIRLWQNRQLLFECVFSPSMAFMHDQIERKLVGRKIVDRKRLTDQHIKIAVLVVNTDWQNDLHYHSRNVDLVFFFVVVVVVSDSMDAFFRTLVPSALTKIRDTWRLQDIACWFAFYETLHQLLLICSLTFTEKIKSHFKPSQVDHVLFERGRTTLLVF